MIWLATSAAAADPSPADLRFFETKVRPLLVERCYACHSVGKKQEGGLWLDSKSGWEKGGDTGPAIVPGKPAQSLLIQAVRYQGDDLHMPPADAGGKLNDDQIAVLETWVTMGAPDPRSGREAAAAANQAWSEVLAERKQWWSLQPVRNVDPPQVADADWSGTTVDRFLRARLEQAQIEPPGEADPRTLVRRAYLVFTGLPPTTEEADEFVQSIIRNPQTAMEALIDRLLASPHFGERFARHWLDVVRFTETSGNEWNYDVPSAWRYRDYVIRAFQHDVPFNQLIREHVAGDLLDKPRWNREENVNESILGTACYRFGEVNHDSCVQFGVIGYDLADSQLDMLTKAFQATTVACARCHDHKLDAVSTKDYHALLAILRSSRAVQHSLDGPDVNRAPLARLDVIKKDLRRELAVLWRSEARSIDGAALAGLATTAQPTSIADPLYVWASVFKADEQASSDLSDAWRRLAKEHAQRAAVDAVFNRTTYRDIADFRHGTFGDWKAQGMGLRQGPGRSGDFVVASEGVHAVEALLPAGAFTFARSARMNGALRSPTLRRTHGRISFEVVGGRSSLARLVFNNCQLNYSYQQALHHADWTWVTVNFPEQTEALHPYAELLTFWDSPKYPDPLGKLGKDLDNQRVPWSEATKDPRTWWGVRRVVAHDTPETPRDELTYLARLFDASPPASRDEAARRYADIALGAVEAFASDRATDDDVRWLDWLINRGLLSNRADASPRLAELVAQYREVETQRLALPRTAPGMADEGDGFAQPVFLRGNYKAPGEMVERGYVAAIFPGSQTFTQGSGRRALAETVASADNPLTARVIVNRVWQWVFGAGLVRTPDDFGHVGQQPSHPELLDHLTAQFMADGWSIKRLARTLALSRAFRASNELTPSARLHDPQNLLLSHYPARRAEAEVIRDSVLAASGRLDRVQFGPSVQPYREKPDPDKRLFAGPLDGDGRRSIYLKVQLMEAAPFLKEFNLPGGKVVQGRRDSTNVPAQSLALLNDPFVHAMADFWAKRLIAEDETLSTSHGDEAQTDGNGLHALIDARCAKMFVTALARSPSPMERDRFRRLVEQLGRLHGAPSADLPTSRKVWKDVAHTIFNLEEFLFIP